MEPADTLYSHNQWYVVYCKSGREVYAASMLTLVGLSTYLPEIEILFRKKVRRIPLFSGYFFVQANLQKVGLTHINSTPGVLKLLDFGNGPVAVPYELIEVFRKEIERRSIHHHMSFSQFVPGDTVLINGGPFEGLQAVFLEPLTSGERARVLIHVLGRLSKMQIETNSLEKLSAPPPTITQSPFLQRERRTRGGGRKINRDASDG
jgi:transcriptional antiterminator RfaH